MKTLCKVALCLVLATMMGCASWYLEDCPGDIVGKDVPRLRTSRYRVELSSTSAAAARFLPYALMSAYAYRDGTACHERDEQNPMSQAHADELLTHLAATSATPWTALPELGLEGGCEDNRGMMLHVWKRETADEVEVVLAFRGTSGMKDWIYGNLWWFTRWYDDNQVTRANKRARHVIDEVRRGQRGSKRLRFVATGHSLGGGLAQHVVYAYPDDFIQAIAFSPSPVTGFASLKEAQQRKGCECHDELGFEARMIRIYESYEVLANIRIFHKLMFPPHRHIQEIRFPFKETWNPIAAHNMRTLALNMETHARKPRPPGPWYASRTPHCTTAIEMGQQSSCKPASPSSTLCPM